MYKCIFVLTTYSYEFKGTRSIILDKLPKTYEIFEFNERKWKVIDKGNGLDDVYVFIAVKQGY